MPNWKLIFETSRFTMFNDLKTGLEIIDIYSEFLLSAIYNHHQERPTYQRDADAKIILQMMMTKALHIKNALQGFEFTTQDGKKLNNIFDPTIVASMVRNTYETTGFFSLLFRHTTDQEKRLIIHSLWNISSLSYRQKFEMPSSESMPTEEFRKIAEEFERKAENDRQRITAIKSVIENTGFYINLSGRNKGKIQTMINEKKFLVDLNKEGEVNFLDWKDMANIIGDYRGHFKSIYTYFSMYSHPSRLSVEQFGLMFDDSENFYIEMAVFNLKYFFWLMSIFIADYISALQPLENSLNGIKS